MTLNKIACIAGMLLLACGVYAAQDSNGSANGKSMGFQCAYEDETSNPKIYKCTINQYPSDKAASVAKSSGASVYDSWSDFADGLYNKMNDQTGTGDNIEFDIYFNTDIELGGFRVNNGVTLCSETFKPLQVPPNTYAINIYGQGYTISNFCDQRNGNAGFFSGLERGLVKKLKFKNAYVESYAGLGTNPYAGVVAARASGVTFENVSVEDSTVVSVGGAGGLVGRLSGLELWQTKISGCTVNVNVKGQKVGAFASVLDNSGNGSGTIEIKKNMVNLVVNDDRVATDSNIYVGGLLGYVDFSEDIHSMAVSLSQNRVTLDVNEIESGASAGLVSSPSYFLGSLVGKIELQGDFESFEDFVTSATIKVDRAVSGYVYAGGGFGRAEGKGYASLNLKRGWTCNFEKDTLNASLDIKTSADSREYLGGIVGSLYWAPQGQIEFKSNVVNADIDSKNAGASNVYVGGLAGMATEYYQTTVTERGMQLTSFEDSLTLAMKVASQNEVTAGGLFGYVQAFKTTTSQFPPPSSLKSTADEVNAIDGKNLFEMTSSTAYKLFVGGIVGQYMGENPIVIGPARVQGDMEMASTTMVQGKNGRDTSVVGGIAGLIVATDVIVYDNVSVGNIHRPNFTQNGFIGGVIGALAPSANAEDFGVNVFANYHYGTDDVDVPDALGNFSWGLTRITDWKTNGIATGTTPYFVRYNYRNALKNLETDGGFKIDGDGTIITGTNTTLYNGIIDADVMKSRLFCYVMNNVLNTSLTNASTYRLNWDNEPGELPTISAKMTVFQAKVNLNNIYSDLTSDDKYSLKGYLLNDGIDSYAIGYTEKDGLLPDDFVTKMKNLSVNYAPIYIDKAVDLEGYKMTSNQGFATAYNRKLNVIYHVYDPSGGGAEVPMEDVAPIYYWPKKDTASLYLDKDVVPPALVKENGVWTEYSVVEYLIKCRDDAPSTCTDIMGSPWPNASFVDIFNGIVNDFTSEHSDEIYLVYANYPFAFELSVEGQGDGKVLLYGFDKDGKLTAADSTKDDQGYSKNKVAVTSRIGLDAPIGYKLENWQADVWIASNTYVSNYENFEACYDGYLGSSPCVQAKALASPDSLYNHYDKILEDKGLGYKALKWTASLKDDEMLDMDSVVWSFAPQGRNSDLLLHLHVTPDYKEIPYKLSFYLNTKASDLFFTDGFDGQTFSVATNRDLPKVLRTDSCFVGWSASPVKGDPDGSIYIDESFADSLIYYAKPLKDSLALYAAWVSETNPSCGSPQKMELMLEPSGKNSLYLWQAYAEPGAEKVVYKHYFENGKMLVPAPGLYNATFHVSALPDKDYVLDSLWLYTTHNENTQKDVVIPSANSDSAFTIMLEAIFEYSLEPKFCKYISVAYDLNSDRKSVFYGEQSLIDNAVMVKDNAGWLSLPRWIYTDDACVLGWAVKPDADTLDFYDYATNQAIIQALSDGKTLHAVWGDAEQCVNDAYYKKARLVAKNGTIEFDEFLYEGFKDSADSRTHKFVGDSIMLLPDFSGSSVFVLRAVEQSGFALDSVVAVYEGLNGEKLQKTLMDGDTLSDSLFNAVFTAYFSEGSAQPFRFVRSEFSQSGSAIRLVLETDAASARRSASLEMALTDALGNLVEKDTLAKKLSDPYNDTIVKCPLPPGVYYLNARLYAGSDTVKFDTSFTVSDEIVVAPNEWRMVSLASVEMDKVVWDDDPVFYWWDESSLGGEFWQYSSLKNSKKVDHEVGYWYNSLDGRPLKLNAENETPSGQVVWRLDSVYSGWNLVANPYGWSIDIYGENRGDQDEVEFWRYDSKTGGYEPATEIDPYEGVWAKAHFPMDWHAPAAPAFKNPHKDKQEYYEHEKGKAAHKFALAKANGQNDWTIQAKLTDGNGKADVWNVLGAGKKAVSTEEPPEGMGDHVNLSIVDGKTFLAKSVRVGKSEMEWTLELSASSNRTGYLSFDGLNALREYGLKVFVTMDGKTTEMREGEPLKVGLAKAGKRATVRVAESAPVVLAYELGGVRVLQAGRGLQVSFDASNGLAGKTARVDLVDLKGHVVSTATGKALVGANTVAVEAPLSGLYVVRVRLGGKQSTAKVLVR